MALRYNGLDNTDRAILVALRYRVQLEAAKVPEGGFPPSPESLLDDVINESRLSMKDIVDKRAILRAFFKA